MTSPSPSRIGVLFIASPLFPAAAAQASMASATSYLEHLGDRSQFSVCQVLANDRPSMGRAIQALALDDLDGLIVQVTTFAGAELLHELLGALGAKDLPLALWATEERDEIVTNSLCGAQLWMSTLRRLGRRAVFVMGNVEDAHLGEQVRTFTAAARARSALTGARVGLVGAHADWFTNLAVDPVVLHRRLGITIAHTSLPRFVDACMRASEPTEDDVKRWAEVSFDGGDDSAKRRIMAATYVRLRAGLDSLDVDAIALRDWPEILYGEAFKGTWSALGELSERSVPFAPEGDVMGAVTALAVRAFDPTALPFLTDISGVDRDENHLVTWHYGVSPRLAAGPRSIDAILKQETFAPRPGPLTLLRLSLEPDGRLRVFVTEGQIGSRPAAANRTAALFVPQQTPAHVLIRRFVEEGFEHHVTAVHGHWAQAAGQLAFMLGAELVRV